MLKKLFFCFIFASLLFLPWLGRAVGLRVTPTELKAEITSGQALEKEVIVENPGNEVALYQVYADDFSDWLKLAPASFILESKQSRNVIVRIEPKESGIFLTELSIIAKPLTNKAFSANSGVKIPLEITVFEKKKAALSLTAFLAKISNWQISLKFYHVFLFVLCCFLIFLLCRRHWFLARKRKRGPESEKLL